MGNNEFIIAKSNYKSGLFPERLSVVSGQAIVLRSSITGRSLVISDKTSPWELVSGKFDEKYDIDCQNRELCAVISAPAQEGKFFFAVKLIILLQVLDPRCCLRSSPSELSELISNDYQTEVSNITSKVSILDSIGLANSLLAAFRGSGHGDEHDGFTYQLLNIEVKPDKLSETYCDHIRQLREHHYMVDFAVPSCDAGYYFQFNAGAEIEFTDITWFEKREIDEIERLASDLFKREVQDITMRYSILNDKGLAEDIRKQIEGREVSSKKLTVKLYNAECIPDQNAKQCIKRVHELEAEIYSISKNFESAESTFFFTVTVQAKIKIINPDFNTQSPQDYVAAQIMPRISARISEEAHKFSVVDYGDMNSALNRLRDCSVFSGDTGYITYEIINVECELTEQSRQYANRITRAALDSKATKGEMEAQHNIISTATQYAKGVTTDMLTAINIKVAKGELSESAAILEYEAYLQKCFSDKSANFDEIVKHIQHLRDQDLLAPDLVNSWMDRAKEMYKGLLQSETSAQAQALPEGALDQPCELAEAYTFSEEEVEDAAQALS